MKILKMLAKSWIYVYEFLFIVVCLYALFSFIALDTNWIAVNDFNHLIARIIWCALLFAGSCLLAARR